MRNPDSPWSTRLHAEALRPRPLRRGTQRVSRATRIAWTGLVALSAMALLGSLLENQTPLDGGVGIGPDAVLPGADPGPPIGVEVLGLADPLDVVQRNPLYAAGPLTVVDCPSPGLPDAGPDAQREYHNRMFTCLAAAWSEPLAGAGLDPGRPQLFVFSQPGTSPCGSFHPATGRILAFYCPINQTTYADAEQLARAFPPGDDIAYGLVLAHEYGHHVQQITGILPAAGMVAYEQPAAELELLRRVETQASCFAGMFFHAVEDSYPVTGQRRQTFLMYAYEAFGDLPTDPPDQRTHGTPQTQGRWTERGFLHNDTAECNTFVAPASQVE